MSIGLDAAFDLTCRAYGLASALTWAEEIVVAQRAHFGVTSVRRVVALGMTLAGALVFVLPVSTVRCALVTLVALGAAVGAFRAQAGRDASDDMQMVIGVSLAAGVGPWADDAVRTCALAAITLHLSVCYLVSAHAKVRDERWRNGTAISDVLATETFGLGWTPQGLRHTMVGLGWAVIALELALPLAFLLGGAVVMPALITGLVFHLGIAATMGLSRFTATWATGYVAVYWWSIHGGLLH